MRRMRDSPPELDRLLPAPYVSTSATVRPERRKCSAIQAPNTPAPITTASKLFFMRRSSCSGAQVVQHGERDVEISAITRAEGDLRLDIAVEVRPARHQKIVLSRNPGVAVHVRGAMIGVKYLNAAQSRVPQLADEG